MSVGSGAFAGWEVSLTDLQIDATRLRGRCLTLHHAAGNHLSTQRRETSSVWSSRACARGELALAERRYDDAWLYAAQSLEMAKQSDSRKHVARAQRLQGDILAARGQLEAAASALRASVQLAETIHTPREVWLGKAALADVLTRAGHDAEAEGVYVEAAQVIETIARGLTIPRLRASFLGAEPVAAVYRVLKRRPPAA